MLIIAAGTGDLRRPNRNHEVVSRQLLWIANPEREPLIRLVNRPVYDSARRENAEPARRSLRTELPPPQ